MNQVSLIGRITKDLELRNSSNGSKFVGFTLAVSEYRNGNEFTNFIPCLAWDKNAENMVKFVGKGSLVGVTGKISVRSNNNNGVYETIVNINVDRVEFLESIGNKQQNSNIQRVNEQPSYEQPLNNVQEEAIVSDDDSILWD